MSQNNSDLQVAFYQVAAGFPGEHVFPEGLVPNPAIPGSEGVNNLLSNQAEWLGSREVALQVGDFIFYHP